MIVIHKRNDSTGAPYCGRRNFNPLTLTVRYRASDGREFDDLPPTDPDFWQCQRCLKLLQRAREKRA